METRKGVFGMVDRTKLDEAYVTALAERFIVEQDEFLAGGRLRSGTN